jgi:predicted kinase
VADLAFLVMDLRFHGRWDLATACAEAYFAAAGDEEGRRLLPFYIAYRAVVRAKVEGMQAAEPEVPEAQRNKRRQSAGAHWQLAHGTLEDPLRRPAVVLVGGLPGTGKSTLARSLAGPANFTVIRSDVVRKELAGVPVTEKAGGFYTTDWTERTYIECMARALRVVADGGRAIVDATFADGASRMTLQYLAKVRGIPAVFLQCRADPALVRERLRARRGDASDANEQVYDEIAARWDDDHPRYRHQTFEIDTTDAGRAVEQALGVLRGMGLA